MKSLNKAVSVSEPLCALGIALLLGAPASAAVEKSSAWAAMDVTTTIEFNTGLLRDLGVEVTAWETSAPSVEQHDLSVCAPDAPAFTATGGDLGFLATEHYFDGLVRGTIRHSGGFDLAWRDGAMSLRGFELRAGRLPRSFELFSAAGEHVFDVDHLHYKVYPEQNLLQIFNADVRLSAEMTARIGRPQFHAGTAVGLLSLTARVNAPAAEPLESCTDWSGDVDVALLGISSVGQRARANGKVVMTPSATLKNVGTANVPWYGKFSGNHPPYNNDQHPFLVWSVFRVTPESIHQLGVSGVKHAFLTLNNNCDPGACTDGHILGLGCEDTYGQGTNSSNGSVAVREEIRPGAGTWDHCDFPAPNTPSHFDTDGDCDIDHNGSNEDQFTHGLVVDEADLMDASAEYHFYSWYIVRDDINIFNTMGHRQINPQFSGSWNFSFLTPLTLGSPLDTWVNPAAPALNQQNVTLTTPEGSIQVAVKVTGLGGTTWRYEYAMMNHDFDRGVAAFLLPLDANANVSRIDYRDHDDDPNNDWNSNAGASAVWSMPTPAHSLEWGELVNFTLEVNHAPGYARSTVGIAEPGGQATYNIVLLAPRGPSITPIGGTDTQTGGGWTTVP